MAIGALDRLTGTIVVEVTVKKDPAASRWYQAMFFCMTFATQDFTEIDGIFPWFSMLPVFWMMHL
jgi:hypothetical protein